jgi:hypothetical protein
MGRLWMIIGSVLAVATVGFATYNVVSLIAHEEVTETTTVHADGITSIRLHNDNGTVEILGDDDVDEVTIVAEISHGLRRTVTEATVEGDVLVVDMDCPTSLNQVWCSVDYRLVVPAALDLDVHNENGRLVLRDIDGDVIADGDNGRVELARLTGDVDASTDNGSLRASGLRGDVVHGRSSNGSVRLSFAEAPTTVTARTSNGSVEVVVPEDDTAYRVAADSTIGSIDTAVRTDPSSDRTITADTQHGSITVRYPTG